MNQTNAAPRVPKTCAEVGCAQETLNTTLHVCYKHQATAGCVTLPPIQGAGSPSPSRTPKDGERKAKRTRTGLFDSGSVPSSARLNGSSPSGQIIPNTQKPWASMQQASPSRDSSRQNVTGKLPGTVVRSGNARLGGLLGTNIGSHPKLLPAIKSSAAPNSTNGPLVHHRAVPPTSIAPQRIPDNIQKTYGRDMAAAAKLSNSSRWFHTPQSTPYARSAAISKDGALKTASPDAAPRTPERKPSSTNSSGRSTVGIARPLNRHTENAPSAPIQSHSMSRSPHQHEVRRSVVTSSKPHDSIVGGTNPNETRGFGPVSISNGHKSTATPENQPKYARMSSDPVNGGNLKTTKSASPPGDPAIKTAHVEISKSSIISPKRAVGSAGQDYFAGDNSAKLSRNILADERPRDKPLQAQAVTSNASFPISRAPNQGYSSPSANFLPTKPNRITKEVRRSDISVAEARKKARVSKFDSAAFDSQIYAQDGCLPPPQGIARDGRESASDDPPDERLFLRVNPVIHGMHSRSEDWYAQKAVEIQQRPRRKAWFGKVHERKRWLRSQEKKSHREKKTTDVLGASSFRHDPQPWGYRRPLDFGDVVEDELPEYVRANPAWAKACEQFREDRATKVKMEEVYLRELRKGKTQQDPARGGRGESEKQQEAARQQSEQSKKDQDIARREREKQEKHQKEAARQKSLVRASLEARRFFEEVKSQRSPHSDSIGAERVIKR